MVSRQADPPSRGRIQLRVQARDFDGLGPRRRGDELLVRFAQITGQQQKPVKSPRRVDADDVPGDGHAADLHERLPDRMRVFLEPRSAFAAEDGHCIAVVHSKQSKESTAVTTPPSRQPKLGDCHNGEKSPSRRVSHAPDYGPPAICLGLPHPDQ